MKKTLLTICLLIYFQQISLSQNSSPYQPDFNNREFLKVIETGKKQLKSNPKDSMANYYMGFSYANLGKHKKAIENFKIAKNSGLKGPYLLLWLAKSYATENDNENALNELMALDSTQVAFTNQLSDSVFDNIRTRAVFKKIENNMYKRANPCKFNDKYRKFDFWIGEWDVYVNGQKIAESSITNTNGNCGILENWRPTNSNGGNSISYFDPEDNKWKQNWVAGSGVSHYEEPENYTDGDMQLIAKGNGIWYKMVYTRDEKKDTVRQTMESSSDEGKTWTMAFNGLYKRKQAD